MILPGTSPDEIFRAMMREQEKVVYATNKIINKAKKAFFRCNRFPYIYTELYTVPDSKNTYLLYYYSDSKEAAMYDAVHTGNVLLVNEDNGSRSVYRIRKFSDVMAEKSIFEKRYDLLTHFTGHFFSRYRERGGISNEYSPLELIGLYFGRNGYFEAKLYEDNVVKFPDKYKDCAAFQVRDGIIFGSEETRDNLFYMINRTFVSHSMLKDNQAGHVMSPGLLYDYVDALKSGTIIHNKDCYSNKFKI